MSRLESRSVGWSVDGLRRVVGKGADGRGRATQIRSGGFVHPANLARYETRTLDPLCTLSVTRV